MMVGKCWRSLSGWWSLSCWASASGKSGKQSSYLNIANAVFVCLTDTKQRGGSQNTKGERMGNNVLRKQTSKREMLRKSLAVAKKLDQVVRVSLILGSELYLADPKNAVFHDGTLTDESVKAIKRIARVKRPEGEGVADSRVDKVSKVPWWKRFTKAVGASIRG